MRTFITEKLLDWYKQNSRNMPWRGINDPYHIWISEIMLQQTRIETVIPYYRRWINRFPTVQAVSSASLEEVLLAWEGLGYYGRARRIHEAATLIVSKYGGSLPEDIRQLREIPGIGPYTAGAIASIAFHLDEPTLDGNIRRVFCRLFNIAEIEKSKTSEKKLWEIARENMPPGSAGDYNQALMDLGATICTVKYPRCSQCPLGIHCKAKALGVQEKRPVKLEKKSIPHFLVCAGIIFSQGKVLISLRPKNGLLGGLWEFPGGKIKESESFTGCLTRELTEELGITVEVGEFFGIYRHAYTHFKVTLHAFLCNIIESGTPQALQVQAWRWVNIPELDTYPMGKIDRMISNQLRKNMPC